MIASGRLSSIAAVVLLSAMTYAHAQKPAPDDDPYASLPPKRAALERMLSERGTQTAFDDAVKKAREHGVGDQAILEARFLYHVDRREDDKIAAMTAEFLKRKETFLLEESEIFAVKEDWLAVVEYVQALSALQKGDRDGFKKHITEAFWLSPRQGSAFAPHIDRMRLDEAMRSVKVDAAIRLQALTGGDPIELGSLMKERKAMLLHFWSPWSRECEESMDDFKVTAAELEKHGVSVASVLAEFTPEAAKDAKEILTTMGGKPPGAWLIDREKNSLLRMLRIQNLPTMALIAPDGSVLFNGHPSEDALWEKLSTLAPAVKRPAMQEE